MSKEWNVATVERVLYDSVHTPPEEPDTVTNVFVQWKGTEACFDMYCECGQQSHFDGYFAYSFKCPRCSAIYEMPYTIFPLKVQSSEHTPVVPEIDEDDDSPLRALEEPQHG